MFVILGARGNTGSVVAQALLKNREKVRVVGRNKDRLAAFVSQGAEAYVADVGDAQALTKAFQGARAVYALVPPNLAAEFRPTPTTPEEKKSSLYPQCLTMCSTPGKLYFPRKRGGTEHPGQPAASGRVLG